MILYNSKTIMSERVDYNTTVTTLFQVQKCHGVPQGLMLGPIRFV